MLDLVLDAWKHQEQRGDKTSPIWLFVSQGRVQPRGYIYGWCINKRRAMRLASKMMDRTGDQIAVLRLSA